MSKIMIVDDNKDIVDTLKSLMESQNYKVEIAYNGEEFLQKIEKFKPKLVLLDVMMPGLTTKEILIKLKDKKLKIILVTAVKFGENEVKNIDSNGKIIEFVAKPFDVVDLLNKVKR